MNKLGQGYGISGARNSYSTDVRVDNWVEDTVGQRLVQQPRPGQTNYETVQMVSYKPMDKRPKPPPAPINMPTTSELKIKNKEGMSYSLLFDHGIGELPSEERFETTSMRTMTSNLPSTTKSLKSLKMKQSIEDLKLSYVKTTESRIANAHLNYTPPLIPSAAIGKTEELPNFNRTATITKFGASTKNYLINQHN